MLNLLPRYAIVDLLPELESSDISEVVQKFVAVHSSGLHFLPVVKSTQQIRHVTPDNIKPFLKKVTTVYDYILIDAGKSLNETLVTVFDYSNLILLAATPDILAVYQVRWCLDTLQSLQFPLKMVKLILNRSESRGSVAWQDVRSALPCEIFSHIPSDGKVVGMALNRGIPCVIDSPRSKVSEAFVRMVNLLKKDDLYVPATEIEKLRNTEALEKPGEFWEKFGITQQVSGATTERAFTSKDDEILILKKKIHVKLVERLNLDGIAVDLLADPESVAQVKKTAEQVVTNLLTEEAGGKIASSEERRLGAFDDRKEVQAA